jgi:hypothetical protein
MSSQRRGRSRRLGSPASKARHRPKNVDPVLREVKSASYSCGVQRFTFTVSVARHHSRTNLMFCLDRRSVAVANILPEASCVPSPRLGSEMAFSALAPAGAKDVPCTADGWCGPLLVALLVVAPAGPGKDGCGCRTLAHRRWRVSHATRWGTEPQACLSEPGARVRKRRSC